jgi:hypothetical protein
MDNKKTCTLVTIYCDIVEDTDAGNDSDKTVKLSPATQQTSQTPTTHCEEPIEPSQHFSPNEKVSTHIYQSMQAQPTQETTHAQQLQNEQLAVVEPMSNPLAMRAVHAPQESLRSYFKKHIPTPIPSGDKNILNKRHGGLTLLNVNVMFLKHEIPDLLLEHGANVNIYEKGKTIAH